MLELGSFLNNDCWTVQVGVGHKTENEMCNVHIHNVMFIRDVKASRPNHLASTSASLSRLCFDLGLMASVLGLVEIGLVASNIYSAHYIN